VLSLFERSDIRGKAGYPCLGPQCLGSWFRRSQSKTTCKRQNSAAMLRVRSVRFNEFAAAGSNRGHATISNCYSKQRLEHLMLVADDIRSQGRKKGQSSLSSVIGNSRIRLPVALCTAFATAAPTPVMPISPIPCAPNGLCGSGMSFQMTSIDGTSM
jgi:hypothetical protein